MLSITAGSVAIILKLCCSVIIPLINETECVLLSRLLKYVKYKTTITLPNEGWNDGDAVLCFIKTLLWC